MRCAVLSPILWFVLAGGGIAKPPTADTREHLIANGTAMLQAWDRSGDGRLSRTEVTIGINKGFRILARDLAKRRVPADLDKRRQEEIAFYAGQDADHDGYLTLEELLKGPLFTFDCMDTNHDGKLTKGETFNGMDRCSTVNLDY